MCIPNHRKVAVFWDYENCSPPLNSQGHAIVNGIRRIAHVFGYVTSFKAYLDVSSQSPKSVGFRSDLQSSGVSMIDCPHNGKKDVVDKMILVDMFAFATENPSPATVILIAGDRDYAYAVSTLRLRQYDVVLIVPPAPNIPQSLESQASVVVDWNYAILGKRTEADRSPVRQPYRNLDEDVVDRLSREIRDPNEDPAVTLISSSLPIPPAHKRRASAAEPLQPSVFERNADSGDAAQPPLLCPPKKATSVIPDTPLRPRFGSVRVRYATQSTQTVPDIDRSSDLPLKENDAFSDEHLADDFVSTANEIQDATYDPFASTIARLERNANDLDLPPTTSSRNIPPSPLPAVPHNLCLKNPPLASPLHTRTISGCTPISYGSAPQKAAPAAVPSSSATSHDRNDAITAPKPTNTGSVSAVMNDYVLPSLMDALGLDDEDGGDNSNDNVTNISINGPLLTNINDPSCTQVANSAESCHTTSDTSLMNSPPANVSPTTKPSVIPTSQMSSSTLSRSSASIVSDSNITMSHAEIGPQQTVSVISDNKDEPSRCQAPPIESIEDKIRRLARPQFLPLINQLLLARSEGTMKPLRSMIATAFSRGDKDAYRRAGVTKFADYISLAEKASVIEVGGKDTRASSGAWIALHPDLFRQGIDAPKSSTPSTVHSNPPAPQDNISCAKTPSTASTPPLSIASQGATKPATPKPKTSPLPAVVPIPLCFQPLIACLSNARKNGLAKPVHSTVGLVLGPAVYSKAGTSSLTEYIGQAMDAGVVQCGGNDVDAWVSLHPDVLSGKRSC